jgi:hypothetical protein
MPNSKYQLCLATLFLISILIYNASTDFEARAAERDPAHGSPNAECDPEGGIETCCWTEIVEGEPIEMNYCQTCIIEGEGPYDPDGHNTYGYCDPVVPDFNTPFPEPEPPSLDPAVIPEDGVFEQGNDTTTPTDQNVVPGGGIVEQGKEIPSSKGTKSPLDTILGFNKPPATSESDDSGLPATGGNEVPTASEDGVAERTRHDDLCPEGQLWDINTARCLAECKPGLGIPGISCTYETFGTEQPEGDEAPPTSRDIPGPPVMSPLTGQSGGDEAPLLAGEEEPEEGCLDTSAPSTCIPCKIGEPGCVDKDKLPQPIPLNEAQKGSELTEQPGEDTTTQETDHAPLATEQSQLENIVDSDNDSIPDEQDNCPSVANEDQLDSDNNGVGDVCDQVEEQPPATDDSSQDQGENEQDQQYEGEKRGSEDTNNGSNGEDA